MNCQQEQGTTVKKDDVFSLQNPHQSDQQQLFSSTEKSQELKQKIFNKQKQHDTNQLNTASSALKKELKSQKGTSQKDSSKGILKQSTLVRMRQYQYGQPRTKEINIMLKSQNQESKKHNTEKQKSIKNSKIMPIKVIADKIKLEESSSKNTQAKALNSPSLQQIPTQDKGQLIVSSQFNKNPEVSKGLLSNQKATQSSFFDYKDSKYALTCNFRESQYSFKNLLQKRQHHFKPHKSIFNRFSYQNYENYSYSNPYKHSKYDSVKDKNPYSKFDFPKNSKYKANQGSTKNLQIVFCQSKHPEFVKTVNQFYEKRMNENLKNKRFSSDDFEVHQFRKNEQQTKSQRNKLKALDSRVSNQLSSNSSTTKWNYSQYNSKTLLSKHLNQQKYFKLKSSQNCSHKSKLLSNNNNRLTRTHSSRKKIGRTTLENCLETFKHLEKLSNLEEKQRESKFVADNKKKASTVSLSIMSQKYQFLKRFSPQVRKRLLKAVFQNNEIHQQQKISIHQYLKFCRLFVNRDSSQIQQALLIARLLYQRDEQTPSIKPNVIVKQICSKHINKCEQFQKLHFKNFDSEKVTQKTLTQALISQSGLCHQLISLIIEV